MDETVTILEQQTRYEIIALLKSEDAAKVSAALQKRGAVILTERPLQKVKLAYPIRKEAFCFVGGFEFTVAPAALVGLSESLVLEPDILRVLVHHAAARDERRSREDRTPRRPAPVSRMPRKPGDVPMLTNEALEKKIEEILQ